MLKREYRLNNELYSKIELMKFRRCSAFIASNKFEDFRCAEFAFITSRRNFYEYLSMMLVPRVIGWIEANSLRNSANKKSFDTLLISPKPGLIERASLRRRCSRNKETSSTHVAILNSRNLNERQEGVAIKPRILCVNLRD